MIINALERATVSTWKHCLAARAGSEIAVRALLMIERYPTAPEPLRNMASTTLASIDAMPFRKPTSAAFKFALGRVEQMPGDDGDAA